MCPLTVLVELSSNESIHALTSIVFISKLDIPILVVLAQVGTPPPPGTGRLKPKLVCPGEPALISKLL